MDWLLIAIFFGGAFVANGIPHFVEGISGRAFQSPFAKPPGKGYSSSTVNLLWGLVNVIAGYALLLHVADFAISEWSHVLVALSGATAMGLLLAKAFGDIHGGTSPEDR